MKVFLAIIVVILFGSSYWICAYVYPKAFLPIDQYNHEIVQRAINDFTDLRYSLYSLIIGTVFLLIKMKAVIKGEIFWWTLGVELSIADIIDRYKFNITKFTEEDIIIIIISLMIAYLEAYTKYNSKNLTEHITNKFKKHENSKSKF